ncbi:DUF1007 family protein [Maritimibacter sp. DP1N21-5]|uniref:DUF1007 family protein n=1 Tax=Maritimibacter sp. DP1N21-5 TaxID=2836867 RepID=UPI001C4811D1|nr:DUF1007 family protein [Maritimibacter sp. DP1N21-5]MBV7407617.1 DUF1007 family protein [Maritimibacter sp. DP1N21-5]
MIRLSFALFLTAALPAFAHPHIFVDARHELIFDAKGRLTALRATWSYDEVFTLLMVEDGGFDKDGDGSISPRELEAMRLWDADWPADFEGDVEVVVGGEVMDLSRPKDWDADWIEGRAVSFHTRELTSPVDVAGGVVIRPFDPYFYVDYDVIAEPVFTGRDDCSGEVVAPDDDAVSAEVAEQVAALPPEASPELLGLGEIGRLYAREVRVTCGG